MTAPRDEIAGLIERLLRGPASSRDVLAWHELTAEAATQLAALSADDQVKEQAIADMAGTIAALSARVKELEARPPLLDARSIPKVDALVRDLEARASRLQQERDKALDDLKLRHNDACNYFKALQQSQQERDEAYERAAKVAHVEIERATVVYTQAKADPRLSEQGRARVLLEADEQRRTAERISAAIRQLASGPEKEKKE